LQTTSTPSPTGVQVPSTQPTQPVSNVINLPQAKANLLKESSMMLKFLQQLMSHKVLADTSLVDSGMITVQQGDPADVRTVLADMIGEATLACQEDDDEVQKGLKELVGKFPGKVEFTYDTAKTSYVVACCKTVETDVLQALASWKNAQTDIPLEDYKADYIRTNLALIQASVQASFGSGVKIALTKTPQGHHAISIAAERLVFKKSLEQINAVLAKIVQKTEPLDSEVAMYLQGAQGRASVKALESKFSCKINLSSPWQRVYWRAKSPKGHEIFICEGNVAAADCQAIVLPMLAGWTEWPSLIKHILQRSKPLFSTDTFTLFFCTGFCF
jgi:hypothetical protein